LIIEVAFALRLEEKRDAKAEVFGVRLAAILALSLPLVGRFDGFALGGHVGLGKASVAGDAIDVLGRFGLT
jgi:hypothetical protein